MGLPQDLLSTAQGLLSVKPQTEAAARRAISTAYYALFHLLIEDACTLWVVADHRPRLSRQFDHRRMRDASAVFSRTYFRSSGLVEAAIGSIANSFVSAQESRHEADYVLTSSVSRVDAAWIVSDVALSFADWDKVKNERLAQDYLFSLLFKDRT
jgi:uncharacterized protein (UPF0332 family)